VLEKVEEHFPGRRSGLRNENLDVVQGGKR
jgi:hypothetical protein